MVHAAAVGAPGAYAGELPVVFVTLRDGATADPGALLDHVRARLDEGPARPRRVEVLDDMPMTHVGKIFKPELRARAAQHVVSEILAQAGCPAEPSARVTRGGGIELHLQGAAIPDAVLALLRPLPVTLHLGGS